MNNIKRWMKLLLGLAVAHVAMSVGADEFPTRPIRLVVPNTPTSNPDIIARVLGPEMSKHLGVPVIIENKPGASQMIGFEYVARQQPADGYALVITAVPVLVSLPITVKDLRFDPVKELPPLAGVIESRLYFGSPSKSPWKTIDELVAYAKANPGKLNYGSTSTITRIYTESLLKHYGINVVHVPYSGNSAMHQALLAGDVHMTFLADGPVTALGEQFRVLAVSGDQRTPVAPSAPTFAELQLPLQSILYTLHVRSGTPQHVLNRLNAAVTWALSQPEVVSQFATMQSKVANLPGDVSAQRIVEVAKVYGDIAKQIGLQPQ